MNFQIARYRQILLPILNFVFEIYLQSIHYTLGNILNLIFSYFNLMVDITYILLKVFHIQKFIEIHNLYLKCYSKRFFVSEIFFVEIDKYFNTLYLKFSVGISLK